MLQWSNVNNVFKLYAITGYHIKAIFHIDESFILKRSITLFI